MLAYLNFQNQTATKSKTKEIQRTYMLLFVHTLVDVAVYQLYRAVWKLESYPVWWSIIYRSRLFVRWWCLYPYTC